MTPTQRAAAERLAAYHAEQADHFSPFGSGNALTIFHGEAAALLRELLAEPPAWSGDPSTQDYASTQRDLAAEPQAEPVAWMVTNVDGQDAYVTADPTLANSAQRALPLYTAPVQDTRACTCHPDDNPPTPCPRKYALGECREAAKAAPVQEPVAWIQPDHLQKARVAPFLCRVEPTKRMSDFVPLYAAPQQPMRCPTDGGECGAGGYCRPEQRKPLTRDELLSLWKQHGYKSAMCEPFARAVEEAHGITGEPE